VDNGILAAEVSVGSSRFSAMTSTAALEDVREMDVRSTLLAAGAERRGADRCEANLLVLAVHTVHLYPVDADTPTVSWADPSLTICDDVEDEPLAGAGSPTSPAWSTRRCCATSPRKPRNARTPPGNGGRSASTISPTASTGSPGPPP
jgi:hypothetical protein